MEWVVGTDRGIAAAPGHASEHVLATDELIYDRGKAGDVLRTRLTGWRT